MQLNVLFFFINIVLMFVVAKTHENGSLAKIVPPKRVKSGIC